MSVSGQALAHYLAMNGVKRGEQRGGAVALVIVLTRGEDPWSALSRIGSVFACTVASPATALPDWQTRLCPVQGLNLALFIYAQDNRLAGRI